MKLFELAVVFFGAIVLSSCSTLHKGSSSSEPASAAGVSGQQSRAVTQGYDQQSGFSGKDLNKSVKLIAPHNQVYRFDFNSNVIHKNDIASLNAQANYLVGHQKARIRLSGNTDERGSREYNVALGWRRAKAVAQFLKQQGVWAKQIVLLSYGEEKPVAFCHNESCWKLNRRVNLLYEAK